MQNKIDFSDLQEEVLGLWQYQDINYSMVENVGFNEPGGEHYDFVIKPAFQAVLDDPAACIDQLGFNTIADYMASNFQVLKNYSKVKLVLAGNLNKSYFRKAE